MKTEIEGIFLWAFAGLQRLVSNNFKFTESQRTRENREAVKRDNNNVFDFLESEGYIRLKADASISSKDCYDIYRMWCEEMCIRDRTDAELYEKYGLTDEEIAFIESMIKPM